MLGTIERWQNGSNYAAAGPCEIQSEHLLQFVTFAVPDQSKNLFSEFRWQKEAPQYCCSNFLLCLAYSAEKDTGASFEAVELLFIQKTQRGIKCVAGSIVHATKKTWAYFKWTSKTLTIP